MQPEAALALWGSSDPIQEEHSGLINRTWIVGDPPWAVLQWVNPIFDPRIHLDVEAVTARLEEAGLTTPRLLPSRGGELWEPDRNGCWRLMTHIPGKTVHRLESVEQAAAAGGLVGRFHAALADWPYRLQGRQRHVHDTTAHMAELHAAKSGLPAHPLAAEARPVAEEILSRWSTWDGELEHRQRFSHGDLKISNVRFDLAGERAVSLIDLDTLGTMPIACEMGDAWRSWCNPAGEDDPDRSTFDARVFTASARAWLAYAPPLTEAERRSLVPGVERVCLELAARFCADALHNAYFREDRGTYPEIGRHNLVRARSQLAVAAAAREARAECEAVVQGPQPSS